MSLKVVIDGKQINIGYLMLNVFIILVMLNIAYYFYSVTL